jgi:hypothetical protein
MKGRYDDNLVLQKYNIYTSRIRNVLSGTSLGFVIVGFSYSNVLVDVQYKSYITFVGVCILVIMMSYGMDNVYDFEQYVNERSLIESTDLLDTKSINNDLSSIKILMMLLLIVIFVILWSVFSHN